MSVYNSRAAELSCLCVCARARVCVGGHGGRVTMSSSCDDILQCSTAPVVTHQSTLQLPAASHRSASSHSQPSSPQSSARRQHAAVPAVLQSVSVDQSLSAPAAAVNHSLLLHYLNSTSTRHAAAGDSTHAAVSCTPPRRRRRPHASPSRPHVRVHSDLHQSTSRERTPSPCLSVSASLSDSTSPVEWEHRADATCGLRAGAAGSARPLHS